MGISTSPSSLSAGGELPTAGGSATTPGSTADECTQGGDSLSISLTLGLPSTTAESPVTTDQNQLQKQSPEQTISNCTEHTFLKRSWLVVQQVPPGRGYRVRRLRHTFSSPEAFTSDELHLPYPDFLSYGTNLPHERSSSNFGSELSRDPSSYSVGKRARLTPEDTSGSETITQEMEQSNQTLQSHVIVESHPSHSESESEAEQQVSCFGAVAQRPKRRHRGHVRSRSFSNARGGSAGRRRLMQRSSSADLLMNYATMAVSTPQKTSEAMQRLFFI